MKIFRNIKPAYIISGMLLASVIFFLMIPDRGKPGAADNSARCEKCRKNKSRGFLSETRSAEKPDEESAGAGFLGRIFSLLTPGYDAGDIQGSDPAKEQAINDINSLSKKICNDGNLPEDVWISPKMIEENPQVHITELNKLLTYCSGMKNGKLTSNEKREYYMIKIRLLEERRELLKYYIETLDSEIEEMDEKMASDMEERRGENSLTHEDEKNNSYIVAETEKYFNEASANTAKMISNLDSTIKRYRAEMSEL